MAPWFWKRTHPVHKAVEVHDTAKLKRLLASSNVNVNSKNANGATAMHVAVSKGVFHALELLLAHADIDPNAQDANGKTALHIAISRNHAYEVQLLLGHHRTDVSLSDYEGRSPLHYAIEAASGTARSAIVSLLLEHRQLNHETQDNHQRTALSWALHLGLEMEVMALISDRQLAPEIAIRDVDGNTALHKAVGLARRSVGVVRLVARQDKAVVNAYNKASETALHIAARKNRDDFLEPFISAGADLEARRGSDGATPFHVAVQHGSYEFAAELRSPQLRRFAFVKDHKGNTPLHLAAARGDVKMVAEIVDRDELVAQVNDQGEAAADVAERHGHADVVMLLLQTETVESETVRSRRRDTAFRILPRIVEGSHASELLEWLAREGLLEDFKSVRHVSSSPLGRCIISAAEGGHADVVQYLVEQGVDPNTRLPLTGTPLAVAADHGHVGVLRFLLGLEDLNPNLGKPNGDTPLMCAVRSRSAASVSILLSDEAIYGRGLSLDTGDIRSIDRQKPDRWHSNPLLLASKLGHDEIVSMLLRPEFGAQIKLDIQNARSQTPLSLACQQGHWRVVKQLLQVHSRSSTIMHIPDASKPSELAVDLADDEGRTPFSYACGSPSPETVKLFLDSNLVSHKLVDVNSRDKLWRTPLTYACKQGRADIVRFLMRSHLLKDRLLDPNTRCNLGLSPLAYACSSDHCEVVQAFLDHFKTDGSPSLYEFRVEFNAYKTLVDLAGRNRSPQMMLLLLDRALVEKGLVDPQSAYKAICPEISRLLQTGTPAASDAAPGMAELLSRFDELGCLGPDGQQLRSVGVEKG